MKPRYVYHWTHRSNLRSILRSGLDPERALGRLTAVWCGTEKRVAWALGHVAQGHGWDADTLVCIRVQAIDLLLTRTALVGVYTVKHLITPDAIDGVLRNVVDGFRRPRGIK